MQRALTLKMQRAFLSTPVPAGSARGPQAGAYSVSMTNSLPGTFIHSFGSEDLNHSGSLDHEDANNNNVLDPGEDLDGDGDLEYRN